MCTICGVLSAFKCCEIIFLQFTLFCQEFFVAIYTLLCGEKLSQKLCLWRKKDKYRVCSRSHDIKNVENMK